MRTLSLNAAAALSALGLRHGHVALLLAPSSLHLPIIWLGMLAIGAMLSKANPLTPGKLADQVRDVEPFLALTTAKLAPKIGSLPTASRVVLVN